MVQKQRREARKKEREAKEAAEEAERRKLVEAEAADAAKKVQEAQRIAIKAAIEMRDNQIKEENEDDAEDTNVSDEILPQMSKPDILGGSETGRHKLKLVDGDIDKASVITERTANLHSYPSRFSTVNKSKSDNLSTSSLLKVSKVGRNTSNNHVCGRYLN